MAKVCRVGTAQRTWLRAPADKTGAAKLYASPGSRSGNLAKLCWRNTLNEAPQQTPKILPADLEALHRELETRFRRVKRDGPVEDRQSQPEGPVLVIRGK
jgi:hypothetical protein